MDSEQSTTAQGNAFRDDVAALLRAAHLEDVETEVRIRHKKVDITFFETTLTQRRRVAVECKDYDRPLTKAQIKEEIYSDYWPLIDEGEIDGLLIVGRVAPNADARSYIDSIRGFQFKTYSRVRSSRLFSLGEFPLVCVDPLLGKLIKLVELFLRIGFRSEFHLEPADHFRLDQIQR
jgi:Restriction endonuclease